MSNVIPFHHALRSARSVGAADEDVERIAWEIQRIVETWDTESLIEKFRRIRPEPRNA